ncbi:transcriptional regulator, partial [Bariatricus massiliensis]|nr:transcriptional regulator [Bariatricus massiliensis]
PAQQELWLRMRDAVREVLDGTTLKYLADFNDTDKRDNYMFYI